METQVADVDVNPAVISQCNSRLCATGTPKSSREVVSREWGCALVDSDNEPLMINSDGSVTMIWNFAALHAALEAAEERIRLLEDPSSPP